MSGRPIDVALLPGALVTGSPEHGTGDYTYALCGRVNQHRGPDEMWHLALLFEPPRGSADILDGVHFHRGALSLWRP